MFQMPDLHKSEPTDFSVMAKPPTSLSAISHKGTASYMANVAKPLAKRMAMISGMGQRKSTERLEESMEVEESSDSTSFTC